MRLYQKLRQLFHRYKVHDTRIDTIFLIKLFKRDADYVVNHFQRFETQIFNGNEIFCKIEVYRQNSNIPCVFCEF